MKKEIIKQQVHKRCGGGVVVGYLKEKMFFSCSKCGKNWNVSNGFKVEKTNEWRDVKNSDSSITKEFNKK